MLFNKVKNLKTFFLEMIAVFIGITASFWVENYREALQKEKVKKNIIQSIYFDLQSGSISNSIFIIGRDSVHKVEAGLRKYF